MGGNDNDVEAKGLSQAAPRSLPDDVRARPGVFVGDLGSGGVAQLVAQLVDPALDAHLSGEVSRIELEVDDDHFCVRDDGPGLAAQDLSPTAHGVRALGAAATRFGGRRPGLHLSLGLVNSLSRRVEIETCRHGTKRRWVFEQSRAIVSNENIGSCRASGTSVRVWPDPAVFRVTRPDHVELQQRLLGAHRVRPSLTVLLDGARFDEPAGVEAWVAGQRACAGREVHFIEARRGTTELELAWAWLPPFGSTRCLSYVNLEETRDDGSHVDGLLRGLAVAHGVPVALAREQTMALLSVVCVNPRFGGAGHTRHHDPGLARWIADLVERHLAGRL